MKKLVCTLFFGLFGYGAYSQKCNDEECDKFFAGCSISFDQITQFRIPNATDVCGGKINELLRKYQDEDNRNQENLIKKACTYNSGWIERQLGECGCIAPPPCCQQEHWNYIGNSAWNTYLSLQKDVYNKRSKEIKYLSDGCQKGKQEATNLANESADKLSGSINKAESTLGSFKSKESNATNYNRYEEQIANAKKTRDEYYNAQKNPDMDADGIRHYAEQMESANKDLESATKEMEDKMKEMEKEEESKKEDDKSAGKKGESSQTNSPPPKSAEQIRQENLAAHEKERREWHENERKQIEAKATQNVTATVVGATAFAGLMTAGIASNTEKNYYRGNSWHVGLQLGLDFDMNQYAASERIYNVRYNGNQETVLKDEESQVALYIPSIGVKCGVSFHPLLSEFIGLGGFTEGAIGMHPVMIIGGGSSISSYSFETTQKWSSLYYKFKYGAEFSAGAKPFKLLGVYEDQIHYIISSFTDVTDRFNSNYKDTENTSRDADVLYRHSLFGGGFRVVPYAKKITLDMLYLRGEYLSFAWGSLQRQQVIPSEHKFRVSLWAQSKVKLDFTFGWEQYAIANTVTESQDLSEDKKFNFEIGFVYNKDWFGKPYFPKNKSKKTSKKNNDAYAKSNAKSKSSNEKSKAEKSNAQTTNSTSGKVSHPAGNPSTTSASVKVLNGYKVEIYSDGSIYDGNFNNGIKSGQGTMTYPNGKRYVGNWENDKPNGQGSYTLTDGTRYQGEFKNGMKNGQGSIVWKNGNKYEGMWKDDKRNGYGIFTHADGSRKDGDWKDDVLVNPRNASYVGEKPAVENPSAPSDALNSKIQASTTSGSLTKGYYVISYSSVSSEIVAKRTLEELQAKGYNNSGYYYIPDYDPTGKPLFKVYVGPFSSVESLQATLAKVKTISPGAYHLRL